jgi:hypothetical protein
MNSTFVKYLVQNNKKFSFKNNTIVTTSDVADYLVENDFVFEFDGSNVIVKAEVSNLSQSTLNLPVVASKIEEPLKKVEEQAKRVVITSPWYSSPVKVETPVFKPTENAEKKNPVELLNALKTSPPVQTGDVANFSRTLKQKLVESTKFELVVNVFSGSDFEVTHNSRVTKNVPVKISLKFKDDRLEVSYEKHQMTIPYVKSVAELCEKVDTLINGFMLMLIAGCVFDSVAPSSFNSFTFFAGRNLDSYGANYDNNNGNKAFFTKDEVPYAECDEFEDCLKELAHLNK